MGQAKRIEKRIHVFHADAVDDDVSCGVVAHGNHQRGNVTESEPRHTGSERSCDAAAADEVRPLQNVWIGEFELALLRLMIELRENGDLDGAGRRKNFIRVEQIFLPGGEVKDGDGEHAVKIPVNPADCRFKLLPQNLLFLLGNVFLRNLLRAGRDWAQAAAASKAKKKSLFSTVTSGSAGL